jgi:hypothetical protein
MPFTRVALASVWLIVLGLFVLSASGTIAAGNGLMWLVLAGLVAPAIILHLTTGLRKIPVVVAPVAAGTRAAMDRGDATGMNGVRR